MRWGRNLRLSTRALTRAWLRTSLSVSAVAIGIAAVVILVGMGAGAERAVREALESLGRNLLVVSATRTETSALRGTSRFSTTLDVEDYEAILREVPDAVRVAPVAELPFRARFGGRTVSVRVHGTNADFGPARSYPVAAGRFIDEDDLIDRRRVAVVGPVVVEGLFHGESPIGETLLIEEIPFRIIGVTRKKGVSSDGANEDELVIVPLTAAMRRLMDVDYLNRIYVQTETEASLPVARTALTNLMRERHPAQGAAREGFDIQDQTAMVRAQQQASGPLARYAIGLGFLALGLGGVGLLAVSMLSVRERHSEIGLRLAVGGRPGEILLQFFTEAMLISTLGGVAGLGVGSACVVIGGALTRWPMVLSWQAVVYPLIVSAAIAVIFGAYPALRAARLDPILALNGR